MTDAIAACLSGVLSPELAISQRLLDGDSPAELRSRVQRARVDTPLWHALDRLCADTDRLARLQHMIAAAAVEHSMPRDPAAIAELFDRAVAVSPEASVALYSLGDPARLDDASREVVDWLTAEAWLRPGIDVLDLGCGIGRLLPAVARLARSVIGLDVSAGMVAEARRRCAGVPNLRLEVASGRDLAGIAESSLDLVLAVDSFPYVVQAGLADAHAAEIARVLRPSGIWVILNLAYGWAPDDENASIAAWRDQHRFIVKRLGVMPFRRWDARGFVLQKPHQTAHSQS